MNIASYLKCAAAAAVLGAAPAAAKGSVESAESGVRSAQSLPALSSNKASVSSSGKVAGPARGSFVAMANAGTFPPYCRGKKVGIYAGKGQKNGNGKALTCPPPDSPG